MGVWGLRIEGVGNGEDRHLVMGVGWEDIPTTSQDHMCVEGHWGMKLYDARWEAEGDGDRP